MASVHAQAREGDCVPATQPPAAEKNTPTQPNGHSEKNSSGAPIVALPLVFLLRLPRSVWRFGSRTGRIRKCGTVSL